MSNIVIKINHISVNRTKKVMGVLLLIYIIMLWINCLTPMIFGDDYVYPYIWQAGQTMNMALPETAQRLTSFWDILLSQWNHYFYWGGRTIAHIVVQFFAWKGKFLFNLFNPLVFLILILQVSWISNSGIITFKNLQSSIICLTFFIFWSFTAGFNVVHLWMPGACNYVWTMVILLFFMLFYVYKYFHLNSLICRTRKEKVIVLLLGIVAGWTNENTICWIILVLTLWFYKLYRENKLEQWMIYGYCGLCIGYILLIFAPGNMVRAVDVTNNSFTFLGWNHIKDRLYVFFLVVLFQLFMWFYVLTTLYKIHNLNISSCLNYINLAKVFCVLSLLSNGIMLFTPDFQPRSGFPSLVFLTISVVIIIRIQSLTGIDFINDKVRKFLTIIGSLYFLVTIVSTLHGLNLINQYSITVVEKAKHFQSDQVLIIPAPPKISQSLMYITGFHLLPNVLSTNENDCKNISFSRFYGIKGVRVVNNNEFSN